MGFTVSAFLFDFKKSLSVVLSFLFMVLSAAGVAVPEQGHGAFENSEVTGSMYASTYKIRKNELIDDVSGYEMFLAKREYEACQLVLKAKETNRELTWDMTAFENDNGDTLVCKVFREQYINASTDDIPKWYPDALIPFSGGRFSLDAGVNQPFYIQVYASPDTPAGVYRAKVTVTDGADDTVQCAFEITATVWNFTLPETPSMDTAMGLDRPYIAKKHGVDVGSPEAQALYEKYYEYLLSHKISAYHIPVDILSDEADAYMSDPRCTSFLIPYSNDDATLVKYYQKVTSNPIWAAKGYFYPIDEPSTADAYAAYCAMTDRLKALCPGYHMVTPFYKYKFTDGDTDFNSVTQQAGRSDILCPISNLYDEDGFVEDISARAAAGDKIWWYVCCGPKGDYCNLFTHWEGIQHRLLFWQQMQNNVTGLLYWSTTYWADVDDVWKESLTTPWTGDDSFGDGSFFYNGNKVGIDGPVSSFRLEAITDGIEDYEYLFLAKTLFGEQYVADTIAKVSKNLTEYIYSDALFAEVRKQLGSDIEAYYNP